MVDDRLPVKRDQPLYLRSACVEEMWPALLEKAYAKAKGSYELLNHWMAIDGCIELTGGVPERVRCLPDLLRCDDSRVADRLFADLARASQMGNIILAQPPTKNRETRLCLAEASQLGLQVPFFFFGFCCYVVYFYHRRHHRHYCCCVVVDAARSSSRFSYLLLLSTLFAGICYNVTSTSMYTVYLVL